MPELPEVETIKNELEPHVIGRTITGVDLPWEGIVKRPGAKEFKAGVTGQKITGLTRHGKYLGFRLDGGRVLVAHLKMTGALLLQPDYPDGRFLRAVIHLDNGQELYFRDPRKFGAMWLVDDVSEVTGKLGPEPLEPAFTPRVLAGLLKGRGAPIKALLCDQGFIAGVGNMYADEALFAAKIHPLREGGSLSAVEVKRLHQVIIRILKQAIGDKGASVQNYYRPSGELGTAHYQFKVAHRRGEDCLVCGTPLKRITVRGRGTYFCPSCQR